MPHTYTPSPVAMTTITEPVDGELESAASVTTMTRAIADGLEFATRLVAARVDVINASGTWTCPAGVTSVTLEMCGGGGGGGGGASTATVCSGGGGGGASTLVVKTVSVTPATVYTTTVGVGGAGGAINTTTTDGTNGGADTTFGALATASGAGPGNRGSGTSVLQTGFESLGPCGTSAKGQIMPVSSEFSIGTFTARGPGCGGDGVCDVGSTGGNHVNLTRTGATSLQGFAGGAGGLASTNRPGGGGGAGGPGGVGGAGGDGGTGASNATVGANAAANTGAGGGGGGGCATGGGGVGMAGGAGGSGFIRVIYHGPQAVIT